MPCLRPVFVVYSEQANSCILKVHYTTYQTQSVHSICLFFKVSEWKLFDANSAIVQLYHGENKLILNEIEMTSALF
jgi:hypothetical protein